MIFALILKFDLKFCMDFPGTKIGIFEALSEYFSRGGEPSPNSAGPSLEAGEEKRGDHCARRFGKVTRRSAAA
jgi:hypothetical protein